MSRGTGRVQSEIIDATRKKNPGWRWNSRTYKWEKDPSYDQIEPGTDDTPNTLYLLTDREKKNVLSGKEWNYNKQNLGVTGVTTKKKKKEVAPAEMQFTSATPEKLKIKKKSGKRDFRYKGSVGMNQSRGLSGISVGGI